MEDEICKAQNKSVLPEQPLYFVPAVTVDFVLLAPLYFVLLAPVYGSASEGAWSEGAMPDLEALYCAKCAMSASNGAWSAGTRPDTEASSCAECAVSASEGAGSKGTKAPGLLIQICPEQLLYFVPTGTVDFVLLAPVYFVLLAPVLGSASEGTGFKGAGQDLEASYCSECAISASDGTWSKEPGQIQRRRPALSAPCPRQKALGPKVQRCRVQRRRARSRGALLRQVRRVLVRRHWVQSSKGAGSECAWPDPEASYCAKCAGSSSEGDRSKSPKAPGQNATEQIQSRPGAPSAPRLRPKAPVAKVQRRRVRRRRTRSRGIVLRRVCRFRV
mmetsp:Transcript_19498/g.38753  ORF Transcript_19498/g.38753 Transcript_19498/m.38753 type:complete len:331 (+) Transcript_19498:1244-2236(+)